MARRGRRCGALALSCSSLEELQTRIAEQSRSLRNPPENAVVLSTIHSAKGLEWDTVFLVGVEDGVLPHANSEDIEEERRVAYVGMTRAERRLGITYSAERYGDNSRPSPFLFEIAGKEKRHCTWTGPRSGGAEDRLPLITAEEMPRVGEVGAGPSAKMGSGRKHDTAGQEGEETSRSRQRKQGRRKTTRRPTSDAGSGNDRLAGGRCCRRCQGCGCPHGGNR